MRASSKVTRAMKRNRARSTAAQTLKALRKALGLSRSELDRKRAKDEWISKPV